MMKVRLRNLTLCVAALMILGVQPVAEARGAGDDGAAGQTVDVRVGREVMVAAHKLKIRFVAVREDSRCPEGVQCIWAGNARVALRLSRVGRKAATVEVNTMREPQEITYANYTIKLTKLAPHPAQGKRMNAGDYVATFIVSKKN